MFDRDSDRDRRAEPEIIRGEDPFNFFFKVVAVVILLAMVVFYLTRWLWRLIFG